MTIACGQQGRHGKGVGGAAAEFIGPKNAIALRDRRVRLKQHISCPHGEDGLRRHIRIHEGSCSCGCLAAQRKSRASRNYADASQFGKTKNDIARDAVSVQNAFRCRCRERHHQERRSARVHRLMGGRSVETCHLDQTRSGAFGNAASCCCKAGLERCQVDAFALKARYRCIDLALGLSIKPTAKQRANEFDVNRFVERRDFDALPQYFDAIIALRRQDAR